MPIDLTPSPIRPQFVTAEALRLAAIFERFDRSKLGGFVEVAIELMDVEDGDRDIEANGDEGDHNHSEDCFIEHERGGGPGCMISDPDYGGEEAGEREEGL